MLPLDLHVLSLPLAFILSQDQTPHCIIIFPALVLLQGKMISLTLTFINSKLKELTLLEFFELSLQ